MMKRLQRALSAFLALVLCLSLAAPAALAAGEDPSGIALKSTVSDGWTPSGEPEPTGQRVYLTVPEGMVADQFAYTVTSDKDGEAASGEKAADRYTVDDRGYVLLNEGKKAIPGEVLTVTAAGSYYDSADGAVLWCHGLEAQGDLVPSPTSNNIYSMVHSDTAEDGLAAARTGLKAGTPAQTVKDGVWSPALNKTGKVVFWYYDPATEEELTRTYYDQVKFGVMLNAYPDFFLGVAVPAGGDNYDGKPSGVSATAPQPERQPYRNTYTYREGGKWWRTSIERTPGWHRFVLDVTDAGTTMTIDGQAVCKYGSTDPITNTAVKSVKNIIFSTNWGDKADMKVCVDNRHFIDDICLLADGAQAKSFTASTTLTVAESAGVTAVYSGPAVLTPDVEQPGQVKLDAGELVIDAMTYAYDDTKLSVSADGVITLKEGYIPAAEETVDVTVNYTYYPSAGVKFVENFNDADAKPFSNTNYRINTGRSRTGLYGVTAYKDAAAKDGAVKSVGPFQNVKVTAWYFDPYDGQETAFDDAAVERFGLAATHDAATPNTNQLGVFANGDKKGHVGVYGYRTATSGNFAASTATRSAGWHRLEWLVDDTGTTMSIDGTQVGQVADRKQVANLTLATNWVNQYDQAGMKLIFDRHYIDDISIVDKDAATKSASATVQVKLAPPAVVAPTITSHSQSQTVTAGERVTLSVQAKGGELTYQWYTCDEKGENAQAIAGATGESYTTAALSAGAAYYYCVVTNAKGTVQTEVICLAALPDGLTLTFGENNTGSLRKGETGRVYLDNLDGYVIADVEYTTDNPNVTVTKDGVLQVKDSYVPASGETVTVTAKVTYYQNADDVLFSDSFEGEKLFTQDAVGYDLTAKGSLFGRKAATASATNKYAQYTLPQAATNVTVTAWYYDAADMGEGQVKFGFGINGGCPAMGIFFDSAIAPYVGDNTKTHYGMRIPPSSNYKDYSWGGSDAERSQGWHKFEWVIDETNGMTARIDGKVVSTHQGTVGKNLPVPELTPVENYPEVKKLTNIRFMNGWSNNAENRGYIQDRHFIDGVTVVKTGAATAETSLTSVAIPLLGTAYTYTPENPVVDSTYPEDLCITVKPTLADLETVALDGTVLSAGQWSVINDQGPRNASYYPDDLKGWKVTVAAQVLKGLADGAHTLTLTMASGETATVTFTARPNDHVPTAYYLSNSGSDTNDGHTPATAWASFEKLSTVTFGPGDTIYLDAQSVWNGVQFRPNGSGANGAPVVLTKYNDSGDASRRPILNGSGTVADLDAHSYVAFKAWRKFYPSGTIEIFNEEYWEVRGIEITNYAQTYAQDGTGRNGIAVIYDYLEAQGLTEVPGYNSTIEEAFYHAGKLQHIVIEDCYIHDVTGYHPGSGASGAGGKMSGGINIYGPYDDLKVEKNIVMYCDVEGIRNDVLAWRGDTRTQFPAYMEGVSISDNFIVGVPGDGVVISSAKEPRLAGNYLADAGYSYLVPQAGTIAQGTAPKPMGSRTDPIIINNSTNFAGLWFIGTENAVAEYNESVNNVWTCNDGEAFDADMYTWGTVFQYNYTYRNNGGLCLFMSGNQMDDGTVVRYNVSVEDGEGVGTPNDGRKATFHYNKEPDAIYNNLFILGENVRGMFGGSSNTAYFYNNIVVKPSGEIGSFNLNTTSNTNANPADMTGKTVLSNNLFYPAAILTGVTGDPTKTDNITPDSLEGIFADLEGFMAAQPVKALNGRGDLTGEAVTGAGHGAGVAMSAADGRAVTAPNGTGFDLTQFEGIKTVEGSPTIGAGTKVTLTIWPQTDDVYPLTEDFFGCALSETPDIGPYQWGSDASHYVSIAFNSNGADAEVDPVTAPSGSTVTLPAPTKLGYTFQGWCVNEDLSGDALTGSYTVPAAGLTLYAKWEKNPEGTYTVTFNSMGGSAVAPIGGVSGLITAPTAPTREHYLFTGWYKEESCTTLWDFAVDTVTADLTLYAGWQGETYTVTFDRNGGDTDASPASMTVVYPAANLTALPTAPTRAGYVFTGWNTRADGTGEDFTLESAVTGSVSVYAQWEAEYTYTVTFDKNGGDTEASPTVMTVTNGSATVAYLPDEPTRAGYDFAGWNTERDGTGTAFTADTPVTGDLTVYAQWQAQSATPSYTVTFDKNGGDTEADPQVKTIAYPATSLGNGGLPTPPTRAGYRFTGWNTKRDGTGETFTQHTRVTANLRVYAQWEALYRYTVTFDKNGGDTDASPAAMTVTNPDTTLGRLPAAPTRAGYDFTGWNTLPDGTGTAFTADTPVTGDLTVYAQWSERQGPGPVEHTVTFSLGYEADGEEQILSTVKVTDGACVAKPADPERAGYTFTGWYLGGAEYDFTSPVTAELTLTARWTENQTPVDPDPYTPPYPSGDPTPSTKPDEKPEEKPEEPGHNVTVRGEGTVSATDAGEDVRYTFTPAAGQQILYIRVNGMVVPVPEDGTVTTDPENSVVVVYGDPGEDYTGTFRDSADLTGPEAEAVNYVVASGLFNGVDGAFLPEGGMTRSMFATVIARLYGARTEGLTGSYTDVERGAWYAGPIAWLSERGLVNGTGEGRFSPDRVMTREEMVALVYRFAQYVGADTTVRADLSVWTDRARLGEWAEEAMSWAVGLGLVNGRSATELAPDAPITRMEAAILLQRLAQQLVKA